jgi:hypothetical protein
LPPINRGSTTLPADGKPMRKLSELVRAIDVEPFDAGNGDAFRFRLEISREVNTTLYQGRVFRLETYRLQPTFPLTGAAAMEGEDDALIYVGDHMFDPDLLKGTSADEVLGKFQARLDTLFGKN